jgi:orotidine-5'-phosphate decarboxylase
LCYTIDSMTTRERLIVALDLDTFEKAKRAVDALSPAVKIFKVGGQLFTAAGPEIIRAIRKKGGRVFLDLKFHDIPNTVFNAVLAATKMGASLLTVHTLGGPEMLRKAAEAARSGAKKHGTQRPLVVGVTVLTSMDDAALAAIGIRKSAQNAVLDLARLAGASGLDGVVASAREARAVRRKMGKKFTIVTPGIRPRGFSKGDQKRVVTPADAIQSGADYLVVGRPVLEAKDPRDVVARIQKEMTDAQE